jgi:HK97 family phage prohead protease
MRYFRGVVAREAMGGQAGTALRFTASTEGIARDGLAIDASAWDLENYRSNPVVLWAHDYSGARPPIGRAERVWVEDSRLMADIMFDQEDDFARSVEAKYRAGFLHSVSVGWDTKAMEPGDAGSRGRVTRADLLDISAVPVPGDPQALIARQQRALTELAEEVSAAVDEIPAASHTAAQAQAEAPAARAAWPDIAAQMAALYLASPQRSAEEWMPEYKRLARAYERLNRVPPEALEPSTIAMLDEGALRGLFLEGEPELLPGAFERSGAVLSRSNLTDLMDAMSLIQRVIERGSQKTGDEEEQPGMRDASDVEALTRLLTVLGGSRG